MKRKKSIKPFLVIFISLLLVLSIPKGAVSQSRGLSIAALTPVWRWLVGSSSTPKHESVASQQLVTENILLKNEVKRLQEILQQKPIVDQFQTIAAKVIYRSPTSWDSALWIDVGQSNHEKVIAKNSPVIVGSSIVGVIDYVGTKQSRVRLVTDSGMSPSVRVLRHTPHPIFLAKGVLHGNNKPLWRRHGHTLNGTGFNYDFADEYGPARDLRTGKPLDFPEDFQTLPIIQEKDLLITTGMDGVFPPGFYVAEVTKVHLLKEGDYYYQIDAKPTAGNLDNLQVVYVIPPIGFDDSDQPSYLSW